MPKSQVCWFCKRVETYDFIDVKVTANHAQRAVKGGTLHTWKEDTVLVPRCSDCHTVHNRTFLFAIAGGLLSSIFGFWLLVHAGAWGPNTFLTVPGISVVSGSVVGFVFNRVGGMLSKTVKPERQKKQYPEIRAMKRRGWR